MGLELLEVHFRTLSSTDKLPSFFVKIVSEGRRQENYDSPTDVLPRKINLFFSEGRRQEKILYLPTSSRAVLSLYAGRRQDNKHYRSQFNVCLRAISPLVSTLFLPG